MQVLAVVGPSDSGKTKTVANLASRLSERGSVGTIKHLTHAPDIDTDGKDTARHRAAGARTTVGLTDEEGWFATGANLTLADALETLSPGHDYALVEGCSSSSLPKLALGGVEPADPVVARAPGHESVDIEAVLEHVENREPFVTLASLVDEVAATEQDGDTGALATFRERVDTPEHTEETVTASSEFERDDTVAAERSATLRAELRARDGVSAVRLRHRPDVVEGETAVIFVVVLADNQERERLRPSPMASTDSKMRSSGGKIFRAERKRTALGTMSNHMRIEHISYNLRLFGPV